MTTLTAFDNTSKQQASFRLPMLSARTQMISGTFMMCAGGALLMASTAPLRKALFTLISAEFKTTATMSTIDILGLLLSIALLLGGTVLLYSGILANNSEHDKHGFTAWTRMRKAKKLSVEKQYAQDQWYRTVEPLIQDWSSGFHSASEYNELVQTLTWDRITVNTLSDDETRSVIRDIVKIWQQGLKGGTLNFKRAGLDGIRELGEILGIDSMVDAYFSGVGVEHLTDNWTDDEE